MWLKRCPRCLLGWWDWPPFDPAAFYDRGYFQAAGEPKGYDDYVALAAGMERTARGRLRRIAQHGLERDTDRVAPAACPSAQEPKRCAPRTRRLLDIGCGTGIFLDVTRRAGWEVRGVEVSAYAVEQARQRGLEIVCQPIEETRPAEAAYDCVTLWDVIEHVRDPADLLQAAGRALRPGGVLALSTGDVTSLCARLAGPRWHLFNLPEHLYFFSPAALERLLARAGCRVLQVTREVNWVPVAYVLERLGKSSDVTGQVVRRLLARAAFGRVGRWVVPATLFDVVGVYAVRAR